MDDKDLFPYQIEGAKFLAGKKVALLADDMGLGKTAQSIRAADMVGAKRILVLCPAVVRSNWAAELESFGLIPRKTQIITTKKDVWSETDTIICSYDLAGMAPDDMRFDLLILDEAHYLKERKTERTKAVYSKKGLVHKADRVWAMTGTPAPNNVSELWPLMFTFGLTKYSYPEFVRRYCKTTRTGYGLKILGSLREQIPHLRAQLAPIMLRRRKDQVLKELPPITYEDVLVEPGPVDFGMTCDFAKYVGPGYSIKELEDKVANERALLKTVLDVQFGSLNETAMQTLAAIAPSVSTLRKYTGLQKLDPVAKLIASELTNKQYQKIVVFAIHRDVVEGLRQRLTAFRAVSLYGGTNPGKREHNIRKFSTDPKCRVFIGNIQSAGTGITLTAAHQVLFIEQDWVPGNNAQAAMRCHRIGQEMPVTVRFVGLKDSLDSRISKILKRKTRDLTEIFDPGLLRFP